MDAQVTLDDVVQQRDKVQELYMEARRAYKKASQAHDVYSKLLRRYDEQRTERHKQQS